MLKPYIHVDLHLKDCDMVEHEVLAELDYDEHAPLIKHQLK